MFPKIGGKPPQNGWWFINNGKPYFKMDDLGGNYTPLIFGSTPKWYEKLGDSSKVPWWPARWIPPSQIVSWEPKGTPPPPQGATWEPPRNSRGPLLRDYLPLVSLNKALLGPYFLGGGGPGGGPLRLPWLFEFSPCEAPRGLWKKWAKNLPQDVEIPKKSSWASWLSWV